MRKYEYLIIGAGLFGVTIAQRLKENGNSVFAIHRDGSFVYAVNC